VALEIRMKELEEPLSRAGAGDLRRLADALTHARRSDPGGWLDYVRELRTTPLFPQLLEDPMTHWAFTKPRGYPGDAVLIDQIYGHRTPVSATTLGRKINRFIVAQPAPRAARFRRQVLAEAIDTATHEAGGACRVLALAAGHLREIELSIAVRRGDPVELVALDQDPESLAVAADLASALGCTLKTVPLSIKAFLGSPLPDERFDLVYAAGLFDYLKASAAEALLLRMLEVAKPGGRVLVANFLPDIPDVGYMEACMDWFLVYRTEDEVRGLHDTLPAHLRGPARTFFDPDRNIVFLETTRP
jgi:extracellular factor (EF) 3-hydroxypalmitic acid methyl ester biosynthesis protein